MAVRFFIVPIVTLSNPRATRGPKYIGDLAGVLWQAMDYGKEDTMLVGADLSAAQITSVSANSDVTTIPAALDSTVGANLATVQSALEALNIPAGWATSGMTYRQIVGVVGRVFQILQRFKGAKIVRLFQGKTLDSTMSDFTSDQQTAMTTAVERIGLSTAGITGSTTLRAAIKALADQRPPFILMGETF